MGIGTKILIGFTLAGPLVLLASVGVFGVGLSVQQTNTLNPASGIETNAGRLKTGCGGGVDQWIEFINSASTKFNLSAAEVAALIEAESSGNPNIPSPVGAQGLMQIMPGTWKMIRSDTVGITVNNKDAGRSRETALENLAGQKLPDNILDPEANIYAGSYYMRSNYNKFHSLEMVLVAYNAGPAWAEKGIVPKFKETRDYIHKITKELVPKYQKCLKEREATSITVSSAIGELTPAAKKVYDYVLKNPAAADQMRNGEGGSGCARTVIRVLKSVFGIEGDLGNNLESGSGSRTDPPTQQNIDQVKSILSKGDLPVWHINGTNSGQHWIVVLKIDDKGNVHYYNPAGGVIESAPITEQTTLDSGARVAYFGMTPKDPAGGRGYHFPASTGRK